MMMTMMALVLTIAAQAQRDDSMDELMAEMMAAKVHQECIDTARLVAVYDYECQTQDAEGKAVTDRMKLCLLVGHHCTRSFPYRKFRKEREWAEGKKRAADDFLQLSKREYMEGYDFFSEEMPMFRAESFCFMPQVWTNYPEGQVTVRDAIPPSIYETQETREPIKWTLGLTPSPSPRGEGSSYSQDGDGEERSNLKILFSLPNTYLYSGLTIHSCDCFFHVLIPSDAKLKANDDVAACWWEKPENIRVEDFGLHSARIGLQRFLELKKKGKI